MIRELVFDGSFHYAASLCSAGDAETANSTYIQEQVKLLLLLFIVTDS